MQELTCISAANLNIAASYIPNPAAATPVRLVRLAGGVQDVATLQDAYTAAVTGDTILLQAGTLVGPLLADKPINVTIKGGYEATYSTTCSPTTVQGKITIKAGTVRTEKISVK